MKKFTEEQFDKFVRDSLYNYEQKPPKEVFESLKKEMLPKQSFWKFKFISSSIIILSSITFIYYFINLKNDSTNFIRENNNFVVQEKLKQPHQNEINIKTNKSENISFPTNKNLNKSNISNKNIPETNYENTIQQASTIRNEQNNDNTLKQLLKEKITYQIITKASTCKQWNGKAIINCNIPDVLFYWKELNVTKNIIENLKYGNYTVYAKMADEIIDTLTISIADSGSVKADFNLYETVLGNEVYIFTENKSIIDKKSWKNNNNVSFYWCFGDGTTYIQAEPRHSFSNSGNYLIALIVKSSQGCSDTLKKSYVVEIPQNFVELPNIFSPNGDGIHDVFSPLLYDMESVECTIFDRNGILIYEWKDINGYWDGKIRNSNKLANPGIYFYILKGITKSGKQISHKGMVQLVL